MTHRRYYTRRLKITPAHYDQLVALLDDAARNTDWPMTVWAQRYQWNGWSGERLRWHWVGLIPALARREFFDAAYAYLEDPHIDAALKAACRELGVETDFL